MDSNKNNFDALRTVLALLVVATHFNVLSGLRSGFFGFWLSEIAVDGFFVISGILVSLSYERGKGFLSYVVRRFFRIYPLYFFIIFFQMCVFVLLVGNGAAAKEYLKYLAANLAFLNFLAPSIGDPFGSVSGFKAINGSLWTLKIEVGFYMVLPLIALLVRRFGVLVLVAIYMGSAGIYCFFLEKPYGLGEQLPAQLRFFVVGMLLLRFTDEIAKRRSALIAFAVIIFSSAISISFSMDMFNALVYPMLIGLGVYMLAFFTPGIKLRWDLSYPIYVLHFPIIQLLLYFEIWRVGILFFVVIFLLILFAASLLVHIFIEVPAIRLGKSLLRSRND